MDKVDTMDISIDDLENSKNFSDLWEDLYNPPKNKYILRHQEFYDGKTIRLIGPYVKGKKAFIPYNLYNLYKIRNIDIYKSIKGDTKTRDNVIRTFLKNVPDEYKNKLYPDSISDVKKNPDVLNTYKQLVTLLNKSLWQEVIFCNVIVRDSFRIRLIAISPYMLHIIQKSIMDVYNDASCRHPINGVNAHDIITSAEATDNCLGNTNKYMYKKSKKENVFGIKFNVSKEPSVLKDSEINLLLNHGLVDIKKYISQYSKAVISSGKGGNLYSTCEEYILGQEYLFDIFRDVIEMEEFQYVEKNIDKIDDTLKRNKIPKNSIDSLEL